MIETIGDRNDRFFYISARSGGELYSLRTGQFDTEPMDEDEAFRRWNNAVQNPDLVLVEVNVIAKKTRCNPEYITERRRH